MKQANALSVIGRSGYFTNLLVVPTALALYKPQRKSIPRNHLSMQRRNGAPFAFTVRR